MKLEIYLYQRTEQVELLHSQWVLLHSCEVHVGSAVPERVRLLCSLAYGVRCTYYLRMATLDSFC